jgi:hypothetical protein
MLSLLKNRSEEMSFEVSKEMEQALENVYKASSALDELIEEKGIKVPSELYRLLQAVTQLSETHWNALTTSPHGIEVGRRMMAETKQQIADGEYEDGGFALCEE